MEKMRSRGIDYLVGTPKGHLARVEKPLLEQEWIQTRESVRVKILKQESEFSVYVESHDRVIKERSMCRRRPQASVGKPAWTSYSQGHYAR